MLTHNGRVKLPRLPSSAMLSMTSALAQADAAKHMCVCVRVSVSVCVCVCACVCLSDTGVQGQPTFKQKMLGSRRQLQDSNTALTAKVRSLEEQSVALQAQLHAEQTGRASSGPPTPHTPAVQPHYFDQVTPCCLFLL